MVFISLAEYYVLAEKPDPLAGWKVVYFELKI